MATANGSSPKVVNVASVPKRSPFRYPGGKTWLVPTVRKWLASIAPKPKLFVEPFAGGGIVGLTVGFEELADTVHLVELDPEIAAVWRVVLSDGPAKWLAREIREFNLTATKVKTALRLESQSLRIKAFQTILKNRVQRGGILAQGAGLMKDGENGRGLASRWYPETLSQRILDISVNRNRFLFTEGDGLKSLDAYKHRKDTIFFIDPPYTVAGNRLYTFSDVDHNHLFRVVDSLSGDFVMTYDDAEEIRQLAHKHNFALATVPMKNTHHSIQMELIIGRDLEWLRPGNSALPDEQFSLQIS